MAVEAILARGLQLLVALSGAYLIALWFVLIVWAYRDIESRSRSVVTQIFSTLLVVLFYIPGLLLYWLLRPKETLDVAFQRSLEEEYLLQDLEELPLCQSCQRYVQDDYVVCPHCHAQLREPCLACTRLVDLRWPICPYCSAAQDGRDSASVPQPETAPNRWSSPALRRRKRPLTPVPLPAVLDDERQTMSAIGQDSLSEFRKPEVAALEEALSGATEPFQAQSSSNRTRIRRIDKFRANGSSSATIIEDQSRAKSEAPVRIASSNGSANGHEPPERLETNQEHVALVSTFPAAVNPEESDPEVDRAKIALVHRSKSD